MYTSAVGIVTCNSAQYIREVIAYNYLVGFDRIIVCIDRSDDDTFNQIQRLPGQVLDRVDVFANSPHRPDVGFQNRAYQTIYDKYKGQVEWLAMFDDDEYFYDSGKRMINDMLQNIPGDVSQIALPWLQFTHNHQILSAPPEVTRLNHFTKREDHTYIQFKAMVRLDHVVSNNIPGGWYYCHCAAVSGKTITFDGKECPLFGEPPSKMKPTHFDTCLVHYVHGSMEDYVIKYRKWKREKDTLGIPLDWSFEDFFKDNGSREDHRMSLYADELEEVLRQCK